MTCPTTAPPPKRSSEKPAETTVERAVEAQDGPAPHDASARKASQGRLVLVVGPSGVGKDTLLERARAALAGEPGIRFVRRVITRPADAGGEDHEAVDEAEFARRLAAGAFFAHWQAHGLCYGLPREIAGWLDGGETVIVNASRAALAAITEGEPRSEVVLIDAPPEVRAARLAGRNREDAATIAERQARRVPPVPDGLPVTVVMNDRTPEEGAADLLAALRGGTSCEASARPADAPQR